MRASGWRSKAPQASGVLGALDLSDVGTWEWDVVEDRAAISEATACFFGFDPVLVEQGPRLADFIAAIHPGDRGPFTNTVTEVTKRGGLFVAEYRVVPSLGRIRWVLARGHFDRDGKGRVRCGRGIVVDVTASKRDGFGEGLALFASDGHAPSLDTAALQLAGAFDALQQLGEPYASEVSPYLREAVLRFAALAAKTVQPEPGRPRKGKLAS